MLLVVINGRILIEKTAFFCYNLVAGKGCSKFEIGRKDNGTII